MTPAEALEKWKMVLLEVNAKARTASRDGRLILAQEYITELNRAATIYLAFAEMVKREELK